MRHRCTCPDCRQENCQERKKQEELLWKIRDLELELDRLTESNANYIIAHLKNICKKCGKIGSEEGCPNCKEQEIYYLKALIGELLDSLDKGEINKAKFLCEKALNEK